jgi:PAS domain S-box-containing protein
MNPTHSPIKAKYPETQPTDTADNRQPYPTGCGNPQNAEADRKQTLILVIDDDALVRQSTVRILEKVGFSMISGDTAAEAVRLTHTHRPTLVLLDVILPDGNGIDVARKIKQDATLAGVFVILLSGTQISSEDQAEGLSKGLADGYITRPFSQSEFLARIDAFLRIRATQEALRESQERYDQLAEQSRTITWEVDTQGLYTFVSPVSEAVLGYRPDELIGRMHIYGLYPEAGREAFQNTVLDIFKQKQPFYHLENTSQSKSGHIVWTSSTGIPLLNSDGTLRGYRGNDTDITDRKQAEQKLIKAHAKLELRVQQRTADMIVANSALRAEIEERKRTENILRDERWRLQSVIEGTRVGTWEWNVQTGETVFNEIWAQILGYTLEALSPVSIRTWESLVCPDDLKKSAELLNRHFSGELPYYDCECRMKHKDGRWVWVRDRGRLVIRTDDGKPLMMFGTHSDITDRKQTEEKLQESLLRIEHLAEQNHSVEWEVDADGMYTYVSQLSEAFYGYCPDELVGRMHFYDLHPEDGRESLKQAAFDTFDRRGPFINLENPVQTRDGRRIWLSTYGIPLLNPDGTLKCYRGRDTNITDRKNAEIERTRLQAQLLQAQKMEAIGLLAGGITHDLNNILFPICGLSEMLLDEFPPNSHSGEIIHQIHKSALRGADLVKQIQAFSRQSQTEKMPVRIQPVLQEVLKLFRATIPQNIEITHHIQTDCGMISANPTQIHQILMNLITNAFHAIEQPIGTIHVALNETTFETAGLIAHSMQSDRFACITVQDTGVGIDRSVIDKIFIPYFTTKEKGKGTGIGLSVVHGIVKEYGGDIRVYSEVGKGTIFHVYLPILTSADDTVPAEVPEKYPTGREHILLVDDEKPIADLIRMMLQKLEYSVTVRTNSLEALNEFRASPLNFDLVISDKGMPNMTGFQLAGELTTIRPEIPIIICTGIINENDRQIVQSLGVKELLIKPVGIRKLSIMVRNVLDESAGQRRITLQAQM